MNKSLSINGTTTTPPSISEPHVVFELQLCLTADMWFDLVLERLHRKVGEARKSSVLSYYDI